MNFITVPVAGLCVVKSLDRLQTELVSSQFIVAIHDSSTKMGGMIHCRFSNLRTHNIVQPLLQQLRIEGANLHMIF